MSHQILIPNGSFDSHSFHTNVKICGSLLVVKHFVSHFTLKMKTMQLVVLKRNVSQRTGKCTDFESWWKIEPSACHYFWKKCFLTRLLLVRSLTHQGRWGDNEWMSGCCVRCICVCDVILLAYNTLSGESYLQRLCSLELESCKGKDCGSHGWHSGIF